MLREPETTMAIAERIAKRFFSHQLEPRQFRELRDAVEAALRERDERAAKILDKKADTLRKAAHVVQQPTEEALRMAELAIVSVEDVARTIRNGDTK